MNSLQLCTGTSVCINRIELVFTYAPANQATPASQPASISGASVVCQGIAQTYSCPAVANAASYDWTVPPGWTINSGQGTNIINASPGTSGNICVRAQNTCGNSIYTCLGVILNTNSTMPSGVSASADPICDGSSSTLNLSGGSLGTGASWEWYTGSCGGTPAGTGSSISVSPSVTTTYYVRAEGACNTTACQAVTLNVNPVPVANAGSPLVLTCSTPSAALGGSGGGSYAWTGPGIVSGGNTGSPIIDQPGTYSLVVSSSGCNSAVSIVAVTQNTTAPLVIISAGNGGVLNCNTASLSLSALATANVIYTWAGPGIVSGGNTANPLINLPGTYSLTVTDNANGCSSQATVAISQDNTMPTASIAPTTTITCATQTLTLSGSSSANEIYSWSGPGIISGGNTPNATINQGGNYVYSVTNTLTGCSNSNSIVVAQNLTSPSPGITSSGSGSLTCSETTLTLTASPVSGINYTWSGPGIISGGNTSSATINLPGTYTAVAVNSVNGCSASISTTISQNTVAPVVNIASAGQTTLTCAITSQTLHVASGSNYTYNWSGPGIVSGANTPDAIINLPGNYSVTVTNTLTGCTNTNGTTGSVITIFSNTTPPSATINSTSTGSITCTNTVTTIDATASSSGQGITYSWANSSGTIPNSNTNSLPGMSAGNYTLTVYNTLNGCSSSATISVSSNLSLPTGVNAGADNVLPCDGSPFTLNGTSNSSNVTYHWSGPGSYTFQGQNATGVITPGIYTLSVVNNSNGCSVSDLVTISSQSVHASFISNPTSGFSPLTVNLTNTSSGAGAYSWSFGDGNTSTNINPSNTFTMAGTYTVVLVATSSSGSCTDTARLVIFVDENLSLEIPNVFTPNGDKVNDIFTIKTSGIKELTLQIFNRWGEKLYEYNGIPASWDGLAPGGAKVPDGTYFYFVKATGFNNKTIEQNGTVNIFR